MSELKLRPGEWSEFMAWIFRSRERLLFLGGPKGLRLQELYAEWSKERPS